MKQAIMAYITALINVHNNALERITDRVANSNVKTFTNELNDLLDYVADIPENKQPITVVLNSSELQNLKRENKVLEEHKMQAFKYQQQLICKIEELKKRENECLEGKVKFLQRR